MNMLLVIMSIMAMLTIISMASYLGWQLYRQRKGVNDPSIDTPTFWSSPIINTPQFGPVTPVHFEWETNTSGHGVVQDANGRLRTLSPMHEEELHIRNMLPGVFGASRIEIDWLPQDRALQEQARYAARAGAVGETLHYKHKFDMAQTDAIVERENTSLELEKKVEHLQAINKANFGVVKK